MADNTLRTVKTEAYEMEYFTFGHADRPFVLIPGIGIKSVTLSAAAVVAAYEPFTRDYAVTVFDRKKNIQPGYDVFAMAEDTADAMRRLGIRNACVCGVSQGGMVAQVLAIRHPELVCKMVLGSSLPRQNEISKNTFDRWYRLACGNDIRALNRDVFNKVYSEAYYRRYADIFRKAETDGTPEEMKRFAVLARACRTFDAYDELNKIKCPVLVIGAKEDRVLSVQGSVELAEKLHCECYLYDRFGHAAYDEAPDYRERVLRFFQG